MKKIYLSITSLMLCFAAFSQNLAKMPDRNLEPGQLAPGARVPGKTLNPLFKTQSGPFAVQIDPIEEIMKQKQIDLTSANPQEKVFLTSVFQDSTVNIVASDGSTRVNNTVLLGITFDPKSTLLQTSFEPLCTKFDAYNIDSVFIQASYVKKTPDVDTLYVWLVWGDSTNASVYTKMNAPDVWLAPLSTWRKSVIGPKIVGATGLAGNMVSPAAPASNRVRVKYVLQPTDSVTLYGRSRFIGIPFTSSSPTGVTIPAGNIVSCFYTFVPGGSHTLNQTMYSFTTSVVPTINGFCGIVWNQNSPPVNAVADYLNYQVDKDSWNMAVTYSRFARHNMYTNVTFNSNALGELVSAPRIFFNVTGNSSIGLNELDKKGFALSQNIPNPYKGESSVSYTLAKDASSAVFTITDIMGRVVYTTKVNSISGTHQVKIGSYTPGVYYYSLNVDGKVSTNKMIVE